MCFFIIRCVESTRTNHSCTLIFFLPMYPMSSSCFDMILDKGGERHGHHVCVRSGLGSLLSLLTLTHRVSRRVCWPITVRRRRTSGGARGRQGRRCHRLSTGGRTPWRGGCDAASLLPTANAGVGRAIFATTAGATTTPPPPPPYEDDDADIRRRDPGGGARSTDKKY